MADRGVSLVLACYNESDIFSQSMQDIDAFFDDTHYRPEYVFVDDASQDSTAELIGKYCEENPERTTECIFHEQNQGRGAAVTAGIRESTEDVVGFIDIDLEVPIHHAYPLVRAVEHGADVACAHRYYNIELGNVDRVILSWGYKYLIRTVLGSPFADTEAGCKFFDRETILPVLERTEADSWFWDTEIMLEAEQAGLDVVEEPVLFLKNYESASTVDVWRDIPDYLWNILRYRLGQ